ncbi:MAG TPA: hypothetical protein DHW82_14350 [Spirochaetia bacterium]|nr:MAG: hypothetical protein A2Y41_13365 [Spirochaetes bacterium GWB1_36_13]HCL58172.1 hypothetical protein [Spirochaetia bacterium]
MKKNNLLPNLKNIKSEVLEIVLKQLDIKKNDFFIRENLFQKLDYSELKNEIFGQQSTEEIYKDIKKWRNPNH